MRSTKAGSRATAIRPPQRPKLDGSAIARIILTSGTTGDQKAVALSHDIILRRIQTYDFAFGNRIPACSRVFLDVGVAGNSGYLWGI